MSSIPSWVGPRLPNWMARVSGVALIAVGLSWPALTWPVPGLATTGIAPVLPNSISAAAALAQTPPMGWNGFNRFFHDVSEARVEAQARAMVASGMQAAGYEYVNLDGGWDLLQRGPQGELQPDPAKFPHGIKPVADYVRDLHQRRGYELRHPQRRQLRPLQAGRGHLRLMGGGLREARLVPRPVPQLPRHVPSTGQPDPGDGDGRGHRHRWTRHGLRHELRGRRLAVDVGCERRQPVANRTRQPGQVVEHGLQLHAQRAALLACAAGRLERSRHARGRQRRHDRH
ncbi:MAG: hypothetical protein E6I39_00470 [Chloroflexi bacterium]|nr:MAG: hypothetical protein E6I39_00470 [Chloroflexota bacterium]